MAAHGRRYGGCPPAVRCATDVAAPRLRRAFTLRHRLRPGPQAALVHKALAARAAAGCKQRAPSLSVCVREVASGVPAAAGEGQAANGLANPQACRFVSSGSIFAPPCSAQQILQTAASPGGSAATAAATPLAAAAAAAAAAPAAPTVPLACKRRLGVRAVACIAEGRLSGFVAVSRVLRSRTTKRDRTGTRDKWSTRGCGVAASQHEIPSPIGSKGKRALPSPSQYSAACNIKARSVDSVYSHRRRAA